MGAKTNGTATRPKSGPDGQMNGHADTRLSKRSSKPSVSKRTFTGRTTSIGARLLLWYSLYLAIFRCPSTISDLTHDTPKLCKPYLQARDYAWPHVEPHYKTHVAPYVEKAQPHVARFNEKVYTPASTFAQKNYQTYAAPRVEQARQYAEAEWVRNVKPQYDAVQDEARAQYEASLAPRVNKAWAAVEPSYTTATTGANKIYRSYLVPAYTRALPYAQQGYKQGRRFTT
ncbi:hypothetical protein LTS18_012107, partial [Coniosporium uncinatum]